MRLTKIDHDLCLKACSDPRATKEERDFLAYMASMAAALEDVSSEEYMRVQTLTGGAFSREGPIFEREMPRIAMGYYSAIDGRYLRLGFECGPYADAAYQEAVDRNSMFGQKAHHALFVVTKYDAGTDSIIEWEKYSDALPPGKSLNDFSEAPKQ